MQRSERCEVHRSIRMSPAGRGGAGRGGAERAGAIASPFTGVWPLQTSMRRAALLQQLAGVASAFQNGIQEIGESIKVSAEFSS